MKTKLKLSFLIISALFLNACVTGTRYIDLEVPEHTSSGKNTGEIYIGTINDERVFENRPKKPSTPSVKGNDISKTTPTSRAKLIGRQRNGYGKAMGDISLPEGGSVQQEMKDLLNKGFTSRGYTVTSNENAPVKVDIDINKFWAWFSPGAWAVTFSTEIDTDLKFSNTEGSKTVSVSSSGTNKGGAASNANWKKAYSRGFAKFLENLDAALDKAGL